MGSVLKVLVVDDSTVFRCQLRAALADEQDISVVGYLGDGQRACDALQNHSVDVVILDLEMPGMSGLDVLREIKRLEINTRVLVFSSLTKSGAESTLTALQLGASDFLLKPKMESSGMTPAELIRSVLVPKINQFRAVNELAPAPKKEVRKIPGKYPHLKWSYFNPEIVVIASSTGGPAALEKLFSLLRPPIRRPILIVQHMPALFTKMLAERLKLVSGIDVEEARDGVSLEIGKVYIAPGDFHLTLKKEANGMSLALNQEPPRNFVRPAADFLFESAARIYKNAVLGIVLTGMGSDGKDGAVAIKEAGGGIFIQNKETCVVFGMPGSVSEAQAYDREGTLEEIASCLFELTVCDLRKAA